MSAKRALNSLEGRTSDRNAERDMRKLFEELGYSLPIPVRVAEHPTESTKQIFTYHIRPQDWLEFWMNTNLQVLAGMGDAKVNCKSFWSLYQEQHPCHEVFQKHAGRLERVLPIMLHGDEGKAVKRTNYFVMSMEGVIGAVPDRTIRCDCNQQLSQRQGVPSYGVANSDVDPALLDAARKMLTNYKGHSFLSRHLLFGMGGWVYKKRDDITQFLLSEVVQGIRSIFENGVRLSTGEVIFAAVVAIKGDMDFHKKITALSRSYKNLGTKNEIEICAHCLAGGPDYAFEDYADDPHWAASIYEARPWKVGAPPYFRGLPFGELSPERILAPDLFHNFKLGTGRDVVGGCLILLLRLGYFDHDGASKDITERFKRAHSNFALWCRVSGKRPGLHSFSKSFFAMKSLVSAPWAQSKGSDTILLLEWLVFVLQLQLSDPVVRGHDSLLRQMKQVCCAGLGLRLVHHHGLFLERSCARLLYVNFMTLLRGYGFLGRRCMELGYRAFIQKPKLHALHHQAFALKCALERGQVLILSPQATACEVNEDFIGRVSTLSRRVGFRMCDLHVCERMFLKVNALLNKRLKGTGVNHATKPLKRKRRFV